MKTLLIILCTVSALVVIILAISASLATTRMKTRIAHELEDLLIAAKSEETIVTESATEGLPSPVRRWVRNTGIIGRRAIHTARVEQKALMKMKAGAKKWSKATAVQYTAMDAPAFIWTVKLDIAPLLSVRGRDKFVNGKGEMLIKLNSLITVVEEKGARMDEGSLQRYLGEMVWYPSLALSPYITWEPIDEFSAKATMNFMGTSGSGTFHFNQEGDFMKFVALRFKGNEEGGKRYPWVLTVEDHAVFDGIKIPSKMKATWKLEEGDWTWLYLTITDIKYNTNHTSNNKY